MLLSFRICIITGKPNNNRYTASDSCPAKLSSNIPCALSESTASMLSLKYLVLLFTFYGAIDGKQFRCDYSYFSKVDGFLKLHRIPANWAEARLRCHLEGSKLASPLNNELASVMRSMMDQNDTKCGVYTGIHSFFSKGDFHSIEGIPLSKIPHTWAKGEPDNFNDEERCTVMLGSGELADVNCSEPLPYLCYRTSTGLRASLGDCGTVDIKYNFESRTGSCYKFHKVARTWSRAYMTCAAEGGHLAIINSDTEAQIIKEIYAWFPDNARVGNFRTDMAYIGFHDWGEHSSVEFLTVDGQTLEQAGYAKFESTEPSNSTTGQYCGAVNRRAELFDLWCEDARWFICEKRPDSLLCDDQTQPTAGY